MTKWLGLRLLREDGPVNRIPEPLHSGLWSTYRTMTLPRVAAKYHVDGLAEEPMVLGVT